MFCCWQVSWLKSLESYSSAFGRVNEQEEAGSRCRMVEGIEAEIEAAGFTENKALELLEAAFWLLLAPRAGARPAGSIARRLHPFRPAASASACSTR